MADTGAAGLDQESPVNPYSLLEAVNSASDTVNTAWLILLGVMSYLLITTAGITHKDMLLNNEIPLPILQVKIDLGRFFFFAPIILVLFHSGVVSNLVLLARKALEFDSAIRLLEATDKRTHPLRLELDNYFFVQAIAGPERSRVMSVFLHGMSWLTIVLLPVLILLYIQVVFLPYHDITITTAHRVALLIDVAMLLSIGTFLARSENHFFTALHRMIRQHMPTAIMTGVSLALVLLFSIFVATIPGEPLDRMTDTVRGKTSRLDVQRADSGSIIGFAVPFLRPAADGSLFGLFYRNLVVTDMDLVPDNQVTASESSINLRGRDLRYARLDRTDLHQADFTGADLEGASFVNADLRNVTMSCADVNQLLLTNNRTASKCTNALYADFTRANMSESKMAGIDARGAKFEYAQLTGAEIAHARLAGADFTSARLERADLTGGVTLYGANFLTASLQGADLTNARLMLADFTSAGMQGAVLNHARLEGAILRDADLDGADLQSARLFGADLTGAKIAIADFRGALLWRTTPPSPDSQGLADLLPVLVRAPDDLDIAALRDLIVRIEDPRLKSRMEDGLGPILTALDRTSWTASPDAQKWNALQLTSTAAAEGYRQRLTDSLVRLACRALWANGSVAVGLAKRSLAPTFKGDLPAYYTRIRGADCPASRTIPAKFLTEFGSAADIARGQ
jgi:uncharacterized protein YjbI with pentapeptide repeats